MQFSDKEIKLLIQEKVAQMHILQHWLKQFNDENISHLSIYPGTVDWDKAKTEIIYWRDSGPQGLSKALKTCQAIREGDNNGLYSNLWALNKKYKALSHQAMQSYLKKELGKKT